MPPRLNKKIKCKDGEGVNLANIGLIYHAKGQKEEALKYLTNALKIYKQIGGFPKQVKSIEGNIRVIEKRIQ